MWGALLSSAWRTASRGSSRSARPTAAAAPSGTSCDMDLRGLRDFAALRLDRSNGSSHSTRHQRLRLSHRRAHQPVAQADAGAGRADCVWMRLYLIARVECHVAGPGCHVTGRRRSPTGPRPWSSRPCLSLRLRFAWSMSSAGVSRVPISCTVRPRSPRTCAISCSSRPTSAVSFGVGVAIAASLWCPPGRRRTRSENAGPSRTADVDHQSKEHASRACAVQSGRGSQLAISRCRDRVWHEGHADHTRRRGDSS